MEKNRRSTGLHVHETNGLVFTRYLNEQTGLEKSKQSRSYKWRSPVVHLNFLYYTLYDFNVLRCELMNTLWGTRKGKIRARQELRKEKARQAKDENIKMGC